MVTLPVPPSANARLFIVGGRMVKGKEARGYRRIVEARCRAVCPRPLTGPVAVRVDWYRARRVGDLDNRLKVLLDSVKGLLYADDKQVRRIVAEMHDTDQGNPRMELTVEAA